MEQAPTLSQLLDTVSEDSDTCLHPLVRLDTMRRRANVWFNATEIPTQEKEILRYAFDAWCVGYRSGYDCCCDYTMQYP